MAYPINTGDIIQLTVKYAQSQVVEMMNVLHYRYTGTPTITDGEAGIQEALQWFATQLNGSGWEGTWAPLASNLVNIDKYLGQKVYPTRWAITEFNVATPGDVAQDPLPGFAQWSITKRGEVAARYAVGGIRVPGLPNTFEEGGQIAAGQRGLADDAAQVVALPMEPVAGRTWVPVVYRRTNPGSSVEVAQTFAQYTLRTQRTRISFRGI